MDKKIIIPAISPINNLLLISLLYFKNNPLIILVIPEGCLKISEFIILIILLSSKP